MLNSNILHSDCGAKQPIRRPSVAASGSYEVERGNQRNPTAASRMKAERARLMDGDDDPYTLSAALAAVVATWPHGLRGLIR